VGSIRLVELFKDVLKIFSPIPGPWSAILKMMMLFSFASEMATWPPSGLYLTALPIRFDHT
jgi:hypothetical protein